MAVLGFLTPRSLGMSCLIASIVFGGCGPTQTRTIYQYIESDTTISTGLDTPQAAATILDLEKSAENESRILLKIPTEGALSPEEEFFDDLDLLETAAALIVFPIYITIKSLASIFGCQEDIVSAEFLTKAELVLTPVGSTGALAGRLKTQTLSAPWWSTATWTRSHTFSRQGRWAEPGGDIDSSFTALVSADDSTNGTTTTRFDITDYFESILNSSEQRAVHHGMAVMAAQSTQPKVSFRSSQANSGEPYIVSTYTGPCTPLESTPSSYLNENRQRVFRLPKN